MALRSTLCFVITTVVVSVTLASPLELSPVYRVQRTVLSEDPSQELTKLINEQLSRTNVQSFLKDLLPSSVVNLRSTLADQDLLATFVRSYVQTPELKSTLLRNSVSDNVQSVLTILNSELGAPLLIVSNSTVTIDVDALTSLAINYSQGYIRENYPDVFQQIILSTIIEAQIKQASTALIPYLADKGIPVECVNAIVSALGESNRSKRDLDSLILDLLRPQLAVILLPIQTQIDSVLNNVTSFILSFYVASEPSFPLIGIITNITNTLVIRFAEVVVVFQVNVDAVFTNIINGTSATTSRKRRDVDLELDNVYDFDRVDLAVSHRRVARSLDLIQSIGDLIGGAFGIVTEFLNTLLKNIFISILSAQYANIGQLVTTPLRVVVNWLIDQVLPCSTCESIV